MSGLWLNDFPVDYGRVVIPRYRGAVAKPITIDGIGPRWQDVRSFILGLQGSPLDLKAIGPSVPGAKPGEESVLVKELYVERLIRRSKAAWTLVLYDKRILLASRVADQNYRMRFGESYLKGTDHGTYKECLQALADSVDTFKSNLASDAFVLIDNTKIDDNNALAGFSLPEIVDYLADRANVDLDVTLDAKFTFADRTDIEKSELIQITTGLPWVSQPGFLSLENIVTLRPRRIYRYFTERHCMAVKAYDPGASVSQNVSDDLYIEWEQVYKENGVYYTLEELLAAFGYDGGITDAGIARSIAGNFQGTDLEDDGSDNNLRVRAAITDGWRRLWRLKFPQPDGNLGGWTDIVFGTLNEDGSVTERTADCKWVEFLSVIEPGEDRRYVGADATRNHDAPSPFVPTWDGGPESGIIRLVQRQLADTGNLAVPGALESPLKVAVKSTVDDGQGFSEQLKNLKIIEVEDRGKARFVPSFEMTVYLTATRRLPNDETKWHLEDVEGFANGDIDRVELPVPDRPMCYRDYVDTANNKPSLPDGMGAVLNADELAAEAERAAEVWKMLHTSEMDGEGISESVFGFRDVRLRGPIREITLECEGPKVQSRIAVGNLGNLESRRRVAQRHIAARRQSEKGIAVL